jgi:hypothetical protein
MHKTPLFYPGVVLRAGILQAGEGGRQRRWRRAMVCGRGASAAMEERSGARWSSSTTAAGGPCGEPMAGQGDAGVVAGQGDVGGRSGSSNTAAACWSMRKNEWRRNRREEIRYRAHPLRPRVAGSTRRTRRPPSSGGRTTFSYNYLGSTIPHANGGLLYAASLMGAYQA